MILSSPNPFAWDRCDHSGIGQPGCLRCDPDKNRCLERARYIAHVCAELKQALVAVIRERDALKKQFEDACDTGTRFRDRFMRGEKAIAKARKLMRSVKHPFVHAAYAALGLAVEMSTNHVIFNTKTVTFRCHHCGAEKPAPPLPSPIQEVVKAGNQFLNAHRKCVAVKS